MSGGGAGVSLLELHNKVSQIVGLNNRNVLSHSTGGWKSKFKVWTGSVPSEDYEG